MAACRILPNEPDTGWVAVLQNEPNWREEKTNPFRLADAGKGGGDVIVFFTGGLLH